MDSIASMLFHWTVEEIFMSPSTAAGKSVTTTMTSSASVNTPVFWDRLWPTSGIQFVAFLIVTYVIYGTQPAVGASPDALAAFYSGERTRILVAAALSGLNILNLMWFAAALRTALADAGQDGWGAAATASSAAFGGVYFLLISIVAALAYSIAGSGNSALTSGLNDFAWALVVLSSFPRAMLIMSGSFGLWRAGLISNTLFAAGLAAIVLGVLGGTTWISRGFWAPDGAYSRLIFPIIGVVWILVVSWVLLTRTRPARRMVSTILNQPARRTPCSPTDC
jgi:hypothetical protein